MDTVAAQVQLTLDFMTMNSRDTVALIISSFMIRSSLNVPVCSALMAPQLTEFLTKEETQTATVILRGMQLILWKCSRCTDREYLKVV